MPIAFFCQCGNRMTVRPEYAGSPVRCKACGAIARVPDRADGTRPRSSLSPLPEEEGGDGGQRREYKVLSQRDAFLSGRFDPQRLEQVLNGYARRGWVVRGLATANVGGAGVAMAGAASAVGMSVSHDEILIVMEREV